MFGRRLFFWFEKLKITPAERYAVSVLLALFVLLSAASALLPRPAPVYGLEDYRELDDRFEALSPGPAERPEPEASPDTLESDSLSAEKTIPGVERRINVNTADSVLLQRLSGIGPVYASRIIAYRETFGDFETLDELLNIKGIGKKRLEKIKPFIKLRE